MQGTPFNVGVAFAPKPVTSEDQAAATEDVSKTQMSWSVTGLTG